MEFDFVIVGGLIVDGTGEPPYYSDIGIVGDSIVRITTKLENYKTKYTINAEDKIISPGFIDMHSHSDMKGMILAYPKANSRVHQGVTTELTGNCGISGAPLYGDALVHAQSDLKMFGLDVVWSDLDSFIQHVERSGISVNLATLVGHGTLRECVVSDSSGHDRSLTSDEITQLKHHLRTALSQGAFGLSTGLEYPPGCYVTTEELVEISKELVPFDAMYASHMRDEASKLIEAIEETIAIGERAQVPVQVSHLKACCRKDWNKQQKAIELIEEARKKGVDVMMDVYPYTAYSTFISILLPTSLLEGGKEKALSLLKDNSYRAEVLKGIDQRVELSPGGYDLIVISNASTTDLVGKTALKIAEEWKVTPAQVILRLFEEESIEVMFVGHGMSSENVDTVLKHPLSMVGSDGYSMAPEGLMATITPHPRSYGTFVRILDNFVRARKVIELATAVAKMSGIPAKRLGIKDRGLVKEGMKADLVVMDFQHVVDRSTFEKPHQYPEGIEQVLVNGVLVIEHGKHTGAKPGKFLRKTKI